MFVKICGITSEEDALLAIAMGADAVGFVFAPSSRQLAPGRAADIVKRLPPEILTVGVFRDEAPERVVDIVQHAGLAAAQLHGHESAEDTRFIRERIPVVIKAFPGGDPELRNVGRLRRRHRAARLGQPRLGPGVRLVPGRGRARRATA